MPSPGPLPLNIQHLRGVFSNKTVLDSDVYITCQGSVCTSLHRIKRMKKNKIVFFFIT
jgi:hypothetical protein